MELSAGIHLFSAMLGVALGVIGCVFGIFALFRICGSNSRLKGKKLAILGICGAMLSIAFSLFAICPTTNTKMCKANLDALGTRIVYFYAPKHEGNYPPVSSWCDSIFLNGGESRYICPSAGQGRCHYAINPNAKKNSPDDMVLLFESNAGWNQFGGPELLNTENHRGKGCNILFNDGAVKFVKKEDLDKLRWE